MVVFHLLPTKIFDCETKPESCVDVLCPLEYLPLHLLATMVRIYNGFSVCAFNYN